jgi:hypothetical protein
VSTHLASQLFDRCPQRFGGLDGYFQSRRRSLSVACNVLSCVSFSVNDC